MSTEFREHSLPKNYSRLPLFDKVMAICSLVLDLGIDLDPLRDFWEPWKKWRLEKINEGLTEDDPEYDDGFHVCWSGTAIENCNAATVVQVFGLASILVWKRIAITPEDFNNPELLGFKVKKKDKEKKWRPYLEKYGDRCVEVDAIPAPEIRDRVREAIESHIDQDEWTKLQLIEAEEKKSVKDLILQFQGRDT